MDPQKPRVMFMDTFNLHPDRDQVEIGLMDYVDGQRPEVDGPTLLVTLPLSQFRPLIGDMEKALESPEFRKGIAGHGWAGKPC